MWSSCGSSKRREKVRRHRTSRLWTQRFAAHHQRTFRQVVSCPHILGVFGFAARTPGSVAQPFFYLAHVQWAPTLTAGRTGTTSLVMPMHALRAHERGGPERLRHEQAADPIPGIGDALVQVHAASFTPTE